MNLLTAGSNTAGRNRPSSALASSAYESIFALLLSREIGPGARLTVDQLARRLGVSQTPVRQALVTLEAEGLVTNTHLTGYRATPLLTRTEFNDLFAVRLMLEPIAARLAARHDGTWIKTMQRLEQDMLALASQSGPMPYGVFARLDSDFHQVIATASGNNTLRASIQRLHSHVHLFRLYFNADVTNDALLEHAEIVAAIAAHDPKAAPAAMRRHLHNSQKRLRRAF